MADHAGARLELEVDAAGTVGESDGRATGVGAAIGQEEGLDLAGDPVGDEGVATPVDGAEGQVVVGGDIAGHRGVDPALFESDRAVLDHAFEHDLGAVTAEAAGEDTNQDTTDGAAVVGHPVQCECRCGTVDGEIDHPAVVTAAEARVLLGADGGTEVELGGHDDQFEAVEVVAGRVLATYLGTIGVGVPTGVLDRRELDEDIVGKGRIAVQEGGADGVVLPLGELGECHVAAGKAESGHGQDRSVHVGHLMFLH